MRNRDALTDSQKMFLQSIMHVGFMDSTMVKQTYQNCRERYEGINLYCISIMFL